MEIRNNLLGSSGPDPIDLTKANRDAIRERNPNPPLQPKQPATDGFTPSDAKRVAPGSDLVDQTASVHKRVAEARSRFHVHKRVHEARERFAEKTAADNISVSDSAQGLADTVIAPSPNDVKAAARAQRVSDLKTQYQGGRLDVGSLVAETAYKMLGGE